jgi:hypothetical protein
MTRMSYVLDIVHFQIRHSILLDRQLPTPPTFIGEAGY